MCMLEGQMQVLDTLSPVEMEIPSSVLLQLARLGEERTMSRALTVPLPLSCGRQSEWTAIRVEDFG